MIETLLEILLFIISFCAYAAVGGVLSGIMHRKYAPEEAYILTGIFWPIAVPLLLVAYVGTRTHFVAASYPDKETRNLKALETKAAIRKRTEELEAEEIAAQKRADEQLDAYLRSKP